MLPVSPSPISDNFDRIPDDLLRIIFNSLQDIKSLTNCRLMSKRFNLIVSQTENILVNVDSVVSPEPGHDSWFLLNLIKSILQSLQNLVSKEDKYDDMTYSHDTPSEILKGFENMRTLEVELPSGDLKLGKGTVIRWRAEFNVSLKSCVIFAVQKISAVDLNESEREWDINGGNEVETDALKLRVVWTISALIAASAKHYLLRDVIKEHKELESLVLRDKDGEGVLVMDGDDLNQFREANTDVDTDCHSDVRISKCGWKTRTTIPAVRMRMRHETKLNIGGGVQMKGATLVVIRPAEEMEVCKSDVDKQKDDRKFIQNAFEGIYAEAALALVKKPSYLLEMNSF